MPTEGPERQEVINKDQSAYRRTRASRNYQQRRERLPKDQSVKKLSTKSRAPTEGPERQEVIHKSQSAYRRTGTSKGYQRKPESKNNEDDANHTRIGRSYTMVVPMNTSSHREVGDLAERRRRANETFIRTRADARGRPQDNIRQDDYDT